MPRESAGTTNPNAPVSIATGAPLALHFVYPAELDGLVIDLVPRLELGREAPDVPGGEAPTSRSGLYAVIPHGTVSRRHAATGESVGGIIPTLLDHGGRNGTFVDGQAVSGMAVLSRHAVVRFGDTLAVVDERAPADAYPDVRLPGGSVGMVRLRETMMRSAPSRSPLLVSGETGTGKELTAAEVHRHSGREGPLVKFNCAELSPHLVESQLFGHERGAFTGASAAHTGLFVAAHGGSLFLDEVGEIPAELQAKLLRVLEEGEVRPLGGTSARTVDVRVIAATNRNLLERVEQGSFRRDLYARLSYLELRLPPLRERKQDLFAWIERFRVRFCTEHDSSAALVFRPSAAQRLLTAPWLDNLRGVNRLVHRLLTAGAGPEIGNQALEAALPELAPTRTEPPEPPRTPLARPVSERPTREEFEAAYRANGYSVRATSKQFGRDRRQIYRWLEQFGIERRPAPDDDEG
jgi:DNA-binding NtrC family response regulator